MPGARDENFIAISLVVILKAFTTSLLSQQQLATAEEGRKKNTNVHAKRGSGSNAIPTEGKRQRNPIRSRLSTTTTAASSLAACSLGEEAGAQTDQGARGGWQRDF